jgi:protein TonB
MRSVLVLLLLLLGAGCATPPSNADWTPEQQAEVSAWRAAVAERLHDHGYYPRSRGNPLAPPEGRVTVRFDVFPDGRVGTPQVVQSSGSPLLDGAALTAVLTGAPYPPPPSHALSDGAVSLTVPMAYRVQRPKMVR